MIEVINTEKFKSEIFDFETKTEWSFEGEMPVILNLYASWCGPCGMFGPILEDVEERAQGKIRVLKLDIDQSPEIPALFAVKSVPTTIFLKSGEEPAIASGVISREGMLQAIEDLLGIQLPKVQGE